MSIYLRRRICYPVTVALALTLSVVGRAEKLDLDRIAPVGANQPIPVLDFFREPFMSEPTINPAGTHVAAVVAAGADHSKLMLYELATKKINVIGGRGTTNIESIHWLDDRRLMFSIAYRKVGNYISCAVDLGSPDDAYPLLQLVAGRFIAVPPDDRLHPLMSLPHDTQLTGKYGEVVSVTAKFNTGKILDLTEFDLKQIDDVMENNTRRITTRYPMLETPGGFDLYYLADKEGKLAYGVSSTDGIFALHRFENGKWAKCPEDLDEIDIFGVGDNRQDIVALAPRGEGKPRPLVFMDAATGKQGEVLFQDSNYDFNGWVYRDPASHLIVGAFFDRAGPQVVWFTEAYRNLQKAIDALFPGMVARIMGTDDGGKVVLVNVFSDKQPSIYRWVDLTKRTVSDVQNSRPWIDANRMQPMNVTKFKTRDGRKLDAYVTLPAGASKQNPPPLIVLPHAYGRDRWGYNGEVQFFASRGYAVLQPNYRGSSGYNWMFTEADEWDYRKMHEDVTDAVKALVASGLIDRARIGIVGTGFGGFLAMEGAAFEPGLYKCAVAVSPTCDWAKSIEEQKYFKFQNPYYQRTLRKLGDPKKNPEKFDAISPWRHASSIRSAVFVSFSEYDSTAMANLAKDVVAEVRKNNFPVETISFPNEWGGADQIAHKVELYTKIEAFLAEHLMKATGPAAATSP